MINFDLLTVNEAAKLIEEVHPNNNYLAFDRGGVTVVVAKGEAAKAMMRGLRRMESQPTARRKNSRREG